MNINTNYNLKNKMNMKGKQLENSKLSDEIISKLKAGFDAHAIIKEMEKAGEVEKIIEGVYKKDNFLVQMYQPINSDETAKLLAKVDSLGLKIFPKLKKIIKSKNNNLLTISEIKSDKPVEIQSLWGGGYAKVSRNELIGAYNELKTMIKAGIYDDSLLKYDDCWNITSENKVILPILYNPKTSTELEPKSLLKQFQNILIH